MHIPFEINGLPKPHKYVPIFPADTCLSRCSCTSCYTENIIAVENDIIIPSELPIPVRTALCEDKKERKHVTFDDVELLTYDIHTGSVYENLKVGIDFSGVKKDIGRLKSCIKKKNKKKKKKRKKKITIIQEENKKNEDAENNHDTAVA